MATPAIQTLLTDAQQVLNLNSLSEVRATMAAALANANVGTPLNPNLTTQQLWDQFYLIVRQPESDIESIITNQLMKFLFAPPAPGGVGGNQQVIYNNNGVLAGDSKFLWDDALNKLDIDGSAIISGNLILGQSSSALQSGGTGITIFGTAASEIKFLNSTTGSSATDGTALVTSLNNFSINNREAGTVNIGTSNTQRLVIEAAGDVTVSTGNVVMATSGKGIDFSATASGSGTMTSELLNDYEEGTWTGTLTGGGGATNPTVAVTATGRYTKIGRAVTVQITFTSVNTTGASGIIGITGLPFANSSTSNSTGAVSLYLIGTFTGSPFASLGVNESFINMYANVSNAAFNDVTHNAGTPRFLSTSITYTVA